MRTKRAQRRRSQAPQGPCSGELPDIFGRLNPSLVAREEAREEACPCCVDREEDLGGSAWAEDRELEIMRERDAVWASTLESGPWSLVVDAEEAELEWWSLQERW